MIKNFPTNHKLIKKITTEISNNTNINGRILFLTVSGSHLYGFTSSNSDIDYRGAYVASTDTLLGLLMPNDQYDFMYGVDDVSLFEVRKFLGLALKMNCNIIEHIFSDKWMLIKTKEFIEIKNIISSIISKGGIMHSYHGMAKENYDKWIRSGREYTIKKFLYVIRSLMAGIYFLETNEIEPDLNVLNSKYGYKVVDDLVDLKHRKQEKSVLDQSSKTAERIHTLINKLFFDIDEAYVKCGLPEIPSTEDYEKVNSWLKKIRREDLFQRHSNKVS